MEHYRGFQAFFSNFDIIEKVANYLSLDQVLSCNDFTARNVEGENQRA